jgi:hypothetical protein
MHRIMMGRITWVCATCPEHFTRKYSASRHNNNLHFGNGLIVTLLDYIVGRASHQYLPNDSRTSKNHRPLIHDYTSKWPSKRVSQAGASNDRAYPTNSNNNNNNNNMYENSDPFYYNPTPTAISSADAKPVDKVQDRKRKYDELRTLVSKYCNVEAAEKILAVARCYLSQGDDRSMDEILATFRKNLEGR